MGRKLLFVFVLILMLSIVSLGCGKVTGGGWFLEEDTGDRIEFDFKVKPIKESGNEKWVDLKGSFQLIDTENDIIVSGSANPSGEYSNFTYYWEFGLFTAWEVTVNEEDGYILDVYRGENNIGRWFWIFVYKSGSIYQWWAYEKDIMGEIKFHELGIK